MYSLLLMTIKDKRSAILKVILMFSASISLQILFPTQSHKTPLLFCLVMLILTPSLVESINPRDSADNYANLRNFWSLPISGYSIALSRYVPALFLQAIFVVILAIIAASSDTFGDARSEVYFLLLNIATLGLILESISFFVCQNFRVDSYISRVFVGIIGMSFIKFLPVLALPWIFFPLLGIGLLAIFAECHVYLKEPRFLDKIHRLVTRK